MFSITYQFDEETDRNPIDVQKDCDIRSRSKNH
jgi:hypothetical protein